MDPPSIEVWKIVLDYLFKQPFISKQEQEYSIIKTKFELSKKIDGWHFLRKTQEIPIT